MYVVVEDRASVADAFVTMLEKEGISAFAMSAFEFRGWFDSLSGEDGEAVEGILIGELGDRIALAEAIRSRSRAPLLALCEIRDLEETLALFQAGVDDVLRKPVHVREIVARSNAVWRRINRLSDAMSFGRLRVFFDGRDVEIDGEALELPRRERRILEFLVKNTHRRVTKSQVFSAVYGLFEDTVDEVVVEGHISKLRKKLRLRLGYDVIDAKRYLGYQFVAEATVDDVPVAAIAAAAMASAGEAVLANAA